MIGGNSGWFRESSRHSLAARGVKSAYFKTKNPGYFKTLTEFLLQKRRESQASRRGAAARLPTARILEERGALARAKSRVTQKEVADAVDFARAAASAGGEEAVAKKKKQLELKALEQESNLPMGFRISPTKGAARELSEEVLADLRPEALAALYEKYSETGYPGKAAAVGEVLKRLDIDTYERVAGPVVEIEKKEYYPESRAVKGKSRVEPLKTIVPKKDKEATLSPEDQEYLSGLASKGREGMVMTTAYLDADEMTRKMLRGKE